MSALHDVYAKYASLDWQLGCDKGTVHTYIDTYGEQFDSLRNESIKILEIGVASGYSLLMWEEFFPHGTIYGMDVKPMPKILEGHSRIKFIQADSTADSVIEILDDLNFDVIIDDGCHRTAAQVATFNKLFKFVKPRGFYFIEDVGDRTVHTIFDKYGDVSVHGTLKKNDRLILVKKPENKYPVFVAFYYDATPERIYEKAAIAFKTRCHDLSIPRDISRPRLKSYIEDYQRRNPRAMTVPRIIFKYIPILIEDKLRQYNCPILYVHCDTKIISRPHITLFPSDMSVGYAARHLVKDKFVGVLASPVFFRPSRTAYDFLKVWKMKCQEINTDDAEHGFLASTVRDFDKAPDVKPFAALITSSTPGNDNPIMRHGLGV